MAADRIDTIRRLAREHEADAVLLTFLPDIRWAVGFSGSNGLLLVTPDAAHFITDGRYTEQAAAEVQGAEVHVPGYALFAHVQESGLLGEAMSLLVQADHVTLAQQDQLRDLFPDVQFVPISGLMNEAVAAKTEDEIEAIRCAQHVTEDVFDELLPLIGPGVSETDLAAEIVYQHLKRGASAMAFDPIVGSGPRGALPHGRPSSKTLRPGELIVIDMGCVLDGYNSDMTRTVALGEPEADARRAYDVVLDAQQQAIAAVQAGASGKAIDGIARGVIAEAGLGDYFTHGLGHGVGLQVHEWPRLSHQVEHELPVGSVVTVEPGVYIPGRFGIRIEDLVVARTDGPEVLTRTPKTLLVL